MQGITFWRTACSGRGGRFSLLQPRRGVLASHATDRAPGRGVLVRNAAWWLAAAASCLVLSVLALPVAVWAPSAAATTSAVVGVLGLALLQLHLLRFHMLGRPVDLFAGLVLGTNAAAYLLSAAYALGTGVVALRLEAVIVLQLVIRAPTYLILGVALFRSTANVPPARRRGMAIAAVVGSMFGLLATAALVFWLAPNMPAALDPEMGERLISGLPAYNLLGMQATWLLAINGVVTALLVVIVYRLSLLATQLADAWISALPVGFYLLGISQAHSLLFPAGVPGYASISGLLALIAYLVLLLRLLNRLPQEVAAAASAGERMRLARELHDGLAQDLSLLNLRISQAVRLHPDAGGALSRNLHASHRLAQSALLEARHAITSLRSGCVTWNEFVARVQTFCEETAENHAVDISVRAREEDLVVPAEIEMDVLRMLNETISNAVRHGQAARIEVQVEGHARPPQLVLTVHDDGRGFTAGACVSNDQIGMRSLSERLAQRAGSLAVESGCSGTIVRAVLPLTPH